MLCSADAGTIVAVKHSCAHRLSALKNGELDPHLADAEQTFERACLGVDRSHPLEQGVEIPINITGY
jgi:hypothetical protein